MQPEQPNPWLLPHFIFNEMISAAGAKEAELQGASSVMRVNPNVEYSTNVVATAIEGET
jgi:hypothetical protein